MFRRSYNIYVLCTNCKVFFHATGHSCKIRKVSATFTKLTSFHRNKIRTNANSWSIQELKSFDNAIPRSLKGIIPSRSVDLHVLLHSTACDIL